MGHADIADELHMIVSDRWDATDLNQTIHTMGYLERFLRRVGINPNDLKDIGPPQELAEMC